MNGIYLLYMYLAKGNNYNIPNKIAMVLIIVLMKLIKR